MSALPTRALAAGALGLLLSCEASRGDGPAQVKWDRDACQHCSMVISDRHFVAQVRGGPKNAVAKFDDVGCALKWLERQPWGEDPAAKLWVARHTDGEWLDARTAHYVGGRTSPMGFNFGAVDATGEGIDFMALREQVRSVGNRH